MQKFCTHCGKKLAEVLQFCTYCGAPLGAKPLNPKLVLAEPPRVPSEEPPAEGTRSEVAEDTALEFLTLDFQPLQAAVLRKEVPAEGSAASRETTEEAVPSPIVKAAEIAPVGEEAEKVPAVKEAAQEPAASLENTQGESAAAQGAVKTEVSATQDPSAGNEAAQAEGKNAAVATDTAQEEKAKAEGEAEPKEAAAETATAAEGTPAEEPEAKSAATPKSEGNAGEDALAKAPSKEAAPSAPREEKKEETAPSAERSGSVVAWLFRVLLLLVFIIGGLMVYRGIGFDKLREDPAGTVRQLFGEAAVPGAQDDAFWYPDTKQGALVRGSYDISSGRTVCWYGSTVQKEGRTYANGDGVANWYKSDGSFEQSDEGVFQAGRREGKIKHTYADGRVETIEWKNGEKVQ